MRLKKLKIHGFKSFADRVSLEFHPGITGIVGPNGCGKSNIADAFRWVLGETSAKSLRGKKMEDVIFAGTTTRKPIALAEVSLTLTDIQGFLPTEYDELEITRRCYRNGETEFLINRQTVRMRDVVSLFLDSGMGKHAFSIFEQGNIDEIIQKSPKERRSVFEEAAGILRFFERRKEAERKLELSETNISRVRDICKEIEKQVSHLEGQAKEAETFQKKKQILDELERTLIVAKFQSFIKEREKLSHLKVKKSEEISSIEKAIQETLEAISSVKSLLESKERSYHEMNEILFQARSEKETTAREQESNKERLRESASRLSAFETQKETLEEIQEKSALELKNLEEKINLTKKKDAEKKSALQMEKENFHNLEKAVQDGQQSESKLKEEKLNLTRSEKEIEGEIRETKARIEAEVEKKKKSEVERTTKKKSKDQLTEKQIAQKELVNQLSLEVDEKRDILDSFEKEESALKEKGLLLEKSVEDLQREFVHMDARARSLIRLKEEMEGATPAFKRLIKECSLEKSPLYGKMRPLFEVIKPKGESKSLLLLLLRPYSETFVVNDNVTFAEALDFAKKEKLQDISLFSLTSLKDPIGNSLEERMASHFLKRSSISKTVQEAFNAILEGSSSFVSLEDGGVIDSNFVYTKRKESGTNAFLRESEIEDLKVALEEIDIKRSAAINALQIVKAKKGELWHRKLESDKDLKRCEMRQLESNFLLQKTVADLDVAIKEEAKLQIEENNAKEELTKLELVLKRLEVLILEKQKALKEIETKTQDIFSRHELARLKFEEKRASLAKEQHESEELSFSTLRLEGEIKVLQSKIQDSAREMVRILGEIAHLQIWKEKCAAKSLTFEEALERAEINLSKSLKDNKVLEADILQQKNTLKALEDTFKTKSISIDGLKEQLTKLKIKEAEVESGIRSESENFLSGFNSPIDTALNLEIPSDFNASDAERKAKSLRKEIEEMEGRINMMSIEELKNQSERRTYLQSQVNDMQHSKDEILEIISTLDKESRSLFEDTFTKIRTNFQKNFKVLFGEDGEADLEFVDSEDVLEAGIEIVAKPPGKKMRSINLLSGGEKCLTSMALLFSIFEIKPAPFCILDEIDAPLDDTNVERFLNVVKTFVDRCQFIIITHNKRTMAIADMLFGVSMEERGVSKLLSIEFSEKPAFEHC